VASDQHVQRRKLGGNFRGKGADGRGTLDVQRNGFHAGIGGGGFLQSLLAAARDDHLVAERLKSLRQAPADARAAAGDQNGIASGIHGECLLREGRYDIDSLTKRTTRWKTIKTGSCFMTECWPSLSFSSRAKARDCSALSAARLKPCPFKTTAEAVPFQNRVIKQPVKRKQIPP
jgi:hypothetical protein